MKVLTVFFQNLTPKMIEFLLKRNYSPQCCTKNFLAITTKIQTKTDENRKKTTKIGLAYVQFYETKLHRGRKWR